MSMLPALTAALLFRDSVPAYTQSRTVQAEQMSRLQRCGEPPFASLYASLDRVLVFDWKQMGLTGLGNALQFFTAILATGANAGRATFHQRNALGCNTDCSSSPGEYFHGAAGFDWEWSPELASNVSHTLALRGIPEVRYETSSRGFLDVRSGALFPISDLYTFLRHPAIQRTPFLVVAFNDSAHETNWFWPTLMDGAVRGPGWDAVVREQRTTPHCLTSAFLEASPRLQRLLLPRLARFDSVRAAGGRVVGIHVRSYFADHLPVARPASERRQSGAEAWSALDNLFADCADGRAGPCWQWTHDTRTVLASGGASCGAETLPALGAPGKPPGVFTSLMRCAVARARLNDHWLLYVAGDLPVFSLLCRNASALAGHVTQAAGRHGHVTNSADSCRVDERGELACEWQANPGGSWDRTFVDMWLLGAVDEVVRLTLGPTSTFFDAVEQRAPPVQHTSMVGEMKGGAQDEFREALFRFSESYAPGGLV